MSYKQHAEKATWFWNDSMDTIRSSKSDELFPYSPDALNRHYGWAIEHGKRVGLVSNGPLKEWNDFAAACLDGSTKAPDVYKEFLEQETITTPHGKLVVYRTARPVTLMRPRKNIVGVIEGGGVLAYIDEDGVHNKVVMVPDERLEAMQELKAKLREHPFTQRLVDVYGTPYDTASVISLPASLDDFNEAVSNVIPRDLNRDITPEN